MERCSIPTKWCLLSGVVMLLLCLGCSDPTPRVNENLKANEQSGRIAVVSAQKFLSSDGHARDILVLRDTTTGLEYLAIGGCGVIDTHVVSNGKTPTIVEE